jgi:thymidylate synthase
MQFLRLKTESWKDLKEKTMNFKTISDAFNFLTSETHGLATYETTISRGSFENSSITRLQFETVSFTITEPLNFTLLPRNLTAAAVQAYYEHYILGTKPRAENESYTYAERIQLQLPTVMEMLRLTPNTNQAAITVAQPSDIHLSDPPCLRELTFKLIPSLGLQLTSFWRSNDLGSAFLWNQVSMALLLRDVAEYAEKPAARLVYHSDGLHTYRGFSS